MNKMKDTKNNRKEDGNFKKKNIDHDPQSESSREKFASPGDKKID